MSFDYKEWPYQRNLVVDFLESTKKKHNIVGLWESDITLIRELMQKFHDKEGVKISMNSYLVYVITQAVKEDPAIQTIFLPKKRKMAVFEGVDFNVIVENRLPNGKSVPTIYSLKDADKKSLAEICVELRSGAKAYKNKNDKVYKQRDKLARSPKWLRKRFWKQVDSHPKKRRAIRGTIGLTNLSRFSTLKGPAYAIPLSLHSFTVSVGNEFDTLVPSKNDPRGFEQRRKICLTGVSDHVVIDGIQATEFANKIDKKLQQAIGLDDNFLNEYITLLNEK